MTTLKPFYLSYLHNVYLGNNTYLLIKYLGVTYPKLWYQQPKSADNLLLECRKGEDTIFTLILFM